VIRVVLTVNRGLAVKMFNVQRPFSSFFAARTSRDEKAGDDQMHHAGGRSCRNTHRYVAHPGRTGRHGSSGGWRPNHGILRCPAAERVSSENAVTTTASNGGGNGRTWWGGGVSIYGGVNEVADNNLSTGFRFSYNTG
jgi:hypothetical protein